MQMHLPQRSVLAETWVLDFVLSMPQHYREQVDWAAARQHARIARERGTLVAHAGVFDAGDEAGTGLCVVATDAPGVLATISAALMLEGFDVRQADAFTRQPPEGKPEAVDLFWVFRRRHTSSLPLTDRDAQAVQTALIELLNSGGKFRPRQRGPAAVTAGMSETTVRFVEHSSKSYLTLEVLTLDRTGILLAITGALFAEGIQIIGSQVTTRGLRVHDRFYVTEADGSRLAGTRLQRIQLAVLAAVDGLGEPPIYRSGGNPQRTGPK